MAKNEINEFTVNYQKFGRILIKMCPDTYRVWSYFTLNLKFGSTEVERDHTDILKDLGLNELSYQKHIKFLKDFLIDTGYKDYKEHILVISSSGKILLNPKIIWKGYFQNYIDYCKKNASKFYNSKLKVKTQFELDHEQDTMPAEVLEKDGKPF